MGGGRKAVAPEGSPGPDHLRQVGVGMGRHLLLLWPVSSGRFRDWCSERVSAGAWGEDFLFWKAFQRGLEGKGLQGGGCLPRGLFCITCSISWL